jgi:peptidoglycan hydrolase CwlO-like protein
LGSVVDSKHDMIKSLHATLVGQGEMSYKMFDEVNVHKKTAPIMKKKAEDAAKLSTARHEKNKVATETINSLRDQLAQLQDKSHDKEYQITELVEKCDEYKCRIMDLEDDNMDLLDTIHVSTCRLPKLVFMWCMC